MAAENRRDHMEYTGHNERCLIVGRYSCEKYGEPAMRRTSERLRNGFAGNKNMFWNEVKRVGKSEQASYEMERDINGQIFLDGDEVMKMWQSTLNRCGR